MKTTIIPAKKVMGPDTNLMEIDNIWDYIDFYVEEEQPKATISVFSSWLNNEDDDGCYDCDDSCEDYDGPYEEDNDWKSDYFDAFEDDPEAEWGRKW